MSESATSATALQSSLVRLGVTKLFPSSTFPFDASTKETILLVGVPLACQPSTQPSVPKPCLNMEARMQGSALKFVRRSEPTQDLLTWSLTKVAERAELPRAPSEIIYDTCYPEPVDVPARTKGVKLLAVLERPCQRPAKLLTKAR